MKLRYWISSRQLNKWSVQGARFPVQRWQTLTRGDAAANVALTLSAHHITATSGVTGMSLTFRCHSNKSGTARVTEECSYPPDCLIVWPLSPATVRGNLQHHREIVKQEAGGWGGVWRGGRGAHTETWNGSEGSQQASRAKEMLTDDWGEIGEGGWEKNAAWANSCRSLGKRKKKKKKPLKVNFPGSASCQYPCDQNLCRPAICFPFTLQCWTAPPGPDLQQSASPGTNPQCGCMETVGDKVFFVWLLLSFFFPFIFVAIKDL